MNHYFDSIQPHSLHRAYKDMFRRNLSPFLHMMIGLQPDMEMSKWIEMTNRISSRVVANPEQYVGNDMPRFEITTLIIQEIFDEFIWVNVGSESVLA